MVTVELHEFPADTSVLANIGEKVSGACQGAGFDDLETGQIMLAVDEACTNTIKHGLQEDPENTFQLEIRWVQGEIEFAIREHGEEYDPTKVASPDLTASLENRPIGGLGMYFIKELMDQVEYKVREDGTKILRMVKKK